MLSTADIHWAAGFLEGEGSFNLTKKMQVGITCGQNEQEPLVKLQQLFGGSLRQRGTIARGSTVRLWVWQLWCRRGAGVMMTLYPLMSMRRKEQIEKALTGWKSRPAKINAGKKWGPEYA